MQISVRKILDSLAVEKEENSLISKELLDRTIVWIDRFKTYPDIEININVEGSEVNFIKMLDDNYPQIIESVKTYKRTKRHHGPAKKAIEKIKINHIGVYFSDDELATLCNRAGTNIPVKKTGGDTASRKKLAAYIRAAAFGALPARVPEVNMAVWIELAPVVANLNQIAHKLNKGMVLDGIDVSIFTEINEKFTALRKQLIQAKS